MRRLTMLLLLAFTLGDGNGANASVAPPAGAQINLVSIHMVTPHTGWGGTEAAIVHTDDGGRHWHRATPFIPRTRGYTIGYLDLDVRSGSEAWLAVPNGLPGKPATSVLLYHTTDAGRRWRRIPTLSTGEYDGEAPQIQFIDTRHGWLWITRGASMMQIAFDIYRTVDGGRHWRHVLSESDANAAPVRPAIGGGLPTCDCFQGNTWLTASTGWVAGCSCGIGTPPPLFFRTDNAGHTWRQARLPLPPDTATGSAWVHAPTFFGRRTGVLPVFLALSRRAGTFLDVCHTADGGRTWHGGGLVRVTERDGEDLVTFVDPEHGFLLDDARLDWTSDGGRHWESAPSGLNREHLSALDFVTPASAFALESLGSSDVNRLLESGDGGRTWHRL